MITRLVCGSVLFALAAAASAHSELPTERWCESGRPVPVSEFVIYPETLVALKNGSSGQCPGTGMAKECGQFDDDYGPVKSMASHVCSAYNARRIGDDDVGSTIAVARQPESFLDPEHHRAYRVEQGLSGICVRCEAREQPLPPPRSK